MPGYRTADGEIPVIMLSTWYCTSFSKAENGRAHLYIYDEDYEDVWVDLTMMQPYVYNAFFTVVDAVPNEKGLAADVWHGHDPRGVRFTDVYSRRSDQIEVSFPSEDWEYAAVPADLTTLYRDDDGTGRRMGILCDSSATFDFASNVVPVLRLFDAPDGAPAGLAFAGDHVILLEERDGWFHVKTLRAEGWLPAERVVEVVVRE